MKAKTIFLVMLGAITLFLLFPIKQVVHIEKDKINSNKPFAGTINGQLVGADVCVAYWLEKHKQPNIADITVWKPLGLGFVGFIYTSN